ncbi:response regulator [Sulfurimonas sp.]|uniref:response regulator n=1 Tax=Sulfurimonas sp. TaxID=2022749 RepID=UPI0026109089|nr:response regulator [Sulfurimonas sp.]
MFSQIAAYQNEILAALGIFIIIILYIIFKKEPKKKIIELDIEAIVEDEYDTNTTEKKTHAEDVFDMPQKTVQTQNAAAEIKEEEKELEKEEKTAPLTFTKRPVPPHAKITKDDFKEFSGKRILLAEDNLINQKVILALLADSGIEIVVANDGQEVLDTLEKDTNFMMILMDAHIPNIDGFEATNIIRQNPEYSHIVIVALSGDTAADDVKKMKDAGMSEHLEKPLKMDSLYDVLYAYNTLNAVSTEDKTQSSSASSTSIEILNTKKGLDVCGNDNAFYTDILNEFLQDYAHSDDALAILFKEAKYNEADILLLDISGVGANIGAKQITKIAQEAKQYIKNNAFENLENSLANYKETLRKTVEKIKEYLAKH